MKYRQIIMKNLVNVIYKRDKSKTEKEQKYWSKIMAELVADLTEFETEGSIQWRREPDDGALEKYGSSTIIDLNDLFRRFFGGLR